MWKCVQRVGICWGFWGFASNREELDQGHMSVDRNRDRSLSKGITLSGWKWDSELDRLKPVRPCSPPASGPFMGHPHITCLCPRSASSRLFCSMLFYVAPWWEWDFSVPLRTGFFHMWLLMPLFYALLFWAAAHTERIPAVGPRRTLEVEGMGTITIAFIPVSLTS